MEIQKLGEWNPWWENPKSIEELAGRKRPQYHLLLRSIEIQEITIITGIRRSGKSTLMYQMIQELLKTIDPKQILLINLEDKKLVHDSLDDLYEIYREQVNPLKKAYIFLDEIHRKEGWESWIRKKYDTKTNNKFVISGSSSYLLRREYSTLLTGRNITFEVFPLSFKEFLGFHEIEIEKNNIKRGILLDSTRFLITKLLKQYQEEGGFPEVSVKPELFKKKLLEQYFDDILYKDIIDRYNLDSQKIKEIALFFMTNITGFISLRNIRNTLKISYDTVKKYLSYCKEAFLFFTLDHFSYSFKEQKTRASKIYCIDNGLRNAVSFKFSKDEGKLAENLVFLELIRRQEVMYYWKNKGEVDFIVKKKDHSLEAINVSFTDEISEREVTSLREAKQHLKKIRRLTMITRNTEKIEEVIHYIPLWKWLLLEE